MSLQVWLPLNGNIENKGLARLNNISTYPTGTAITYNEDGFGKSVKLAPRILFYNIPTMYNFTIAFWAKIDACTVEWADVCSFTSQAADGSAAAEFRFEATPSTRACSFHNNSPFAITSDSKILIENSQKGEWHHCCVAYNGTELYTYVDGVYKYTSTGLGGCITNRFTLGEGSGMTGGLRDFRIYDECLTAKQIKEISKGLLLHYTMDKGTGNPNLLRANGIVNQDATSVSYNEHDDIYTIVSPVNTSTWGTGVKIHNANPVVIPYGEYYRTSMDIYVPSEQILVVDYNNHSNDSSVADWNSNDNDLTSARLPSSYTLPAKKWTRVVLGSQNAHASNTSKAAIYENSKIAIRTTESTTSPVTWYIRHPKVELGQEASQWCPNENDKLYKTMGYDSLIEKDMSGNGYHGTKAPVVSNISDSPRYTGSMYKSTRAEAYIYMPTSKIWTTGKSVENLTLAGWYKAETIDGSSKNLINIGDNLFIRFGPASTTTIFAALYVNQVAKYPSWTLPTTLTTNTWHHYAITFNNGIAEVFFDGQSLGQKDYSADGTSLYVKANNGAVGSYQNTECLNGAVSDIRIYGTALSAEDIKELYNTSSYIDKDGSLRTYSLVESGEENLTGGTEYVGAGSAGGSAFTKEVIECPESASGKAFKATCTTAGSGFYENNADCWGLARSKMVNGQKYVWSLYCKSDNRTSITFNVECAASGSQSQQTFAIGKEYKKLTGVFTYATGTTYSAFTSYPNYAVGDVVYIHSFKVQPYNPTMEFTKEGVYKENNVNEQSTKQFEIFRQDTQVHEIIEI